MARQARRIGADIGADVDERKQIIYREAAVAFAENGIQHTSVSDIAERLNVSKPSVYHYVSGKRELVDAVLGIAVQQVEDLILEAETIRPTALARLQFILHRIASTADNPFGQCLARIDAHSLLPEQGEMHRSIHRKLQQQVAEIIRSGIDDGSIRSCNPAVQSFLALGTALNVCAWYRSGGSQSLAIIADQIVDTVTHGIVS